MSLLLEINMNFRYTCTKVYIWIMTFICVAVRHSGIEGWYMLRSRVQEHGPMTTPWIEGIDLTFLTAYAIRNIFSGALQDRSSPHILISAGLESSGLLFSVILVLGYTDTYIPILFLIQFCLQGFVQSTMFPSIVAVFSNWFAHTHLGKIVGLWSICGPIGDIFGRSYSDLIMNYNQEWMLVILAFAVFQIILGLTYWLTVPDQPKSESENNNRPININDPDEPAYPIIRKEPVPFLEVLQMPAVIFFSLSYACVRSLYFGLLLWLPFFLENKFEEKVSYITAIDYFSIGTALGGITCGWLGDIFKFRPPIIAGFLICALPNLVLMYIGNQSVFWMYFIIIPMTGFFLGGALFNIPFSVAIELSQNEMMASNRDATGTIAGIINGVGNFGAGFWTFGLAYVSKNSILYVFLFMILLNLTGILVISKIALNDFYKIRKLRADKLLPR